MHGNTTVVKRDQPITCACGTNTIDGMVLETSVPHVDITCHDNTTSETSNAHDVHSYAICVDHTIMIISHVYTTYVANIPADHGPSETHHVSITSTLTIPREPSSLNMSRRDERRAVINDEMMDVARGLAQKNRLDLEYENRLKRTYFTVQKRREIASLYTVHNKSDSIEKSDVSQRTMLSLINHVIGTMGYKLSGRQISSHRNGVKIHPYEYTLSSLTS